MQKKSPSRPDWGALLEQAISQPGKLADYYRVFWNFSLGNRILAAIQLGKLGLPLSPIASFGKWKDLGRSVKQGAKALSLVMPVTISREVEELAQDGAVDVTEKRFRIFVMKPLWFSLEQTDGEAYRHEISVPEWSKTAALAKLGITEERFEHLDGNCQGYARPDVRRLAVNPLAALPHKTRFHEMAHCLLHSNEAQLADGVMVPKDIKEAEAEAVAYLCCASLGLKGLEESRGYIQSWLSSESQRAEFARKNAARVFGAADRILKAGTNTQHRGEGDVL